MHPEQAGGTPIRQMKASPPAERLSGTRHHPQRAVEGGGMGKGWIGACLRGASARLRCCGDDCRLRVRLGGCLACVCCV